MKGAWLCISNEWGAVMGVVFREYEKGLGTEKKLLERGPRVEILIYFIVSHPLVHNRQAEAHLLSQYKNLLHRLLLGTGVTLLYTLQ